MGTDNNGITRGAPCWCDHSIMTLGWWQSVPKWQPGYRQKERETERKLHFHTWLPCVHTGYRSVVRLLKLRVHNWNTKLPTHCLYLKWWLLYGAPLNQLQQNLEIYQQVRYYSAYNVWMWENTNIVLNFSTLSALSIRTSLAWQLFSIAECIFKHCFFFLFFWFYYSESEYLLVY